jgi:hypothetical protein
LAQRLPPPVVLSESFFSLCDMRRLFSIFASRSGQKQNKNIKILVFSPYSCSISRILEDRVCWKIWRFVQCTYIPVHITFTLVHSTGEHWVCSNW